MCPLQGAEAPGQSQEQLMQTMISIFFQNTFVSIDPEIWGERRLVASFSFLLTGLVWGLPKH